jgi:hypothetical protein
VPVELRLPLVKGASPFVPRGVNGVVNKAENVNDSVNNVNEAVNTDRKAYMREYMRKRRERDGG